MKYVYQSTGVPDMWTGEPVLASITAYDTEIGPPTIGLNLERRLGERIAELHIDAGEALLWADRFRRAAEIAIAACEMTQEDYEKRGGEETGGIRLTATGRAASSLSSIRGGAARLSTARSMPPRASER